MDTIAIKQGNNTPKVFRWPLGLDLTGYTFELVVTWPKNQKVYAIGSGLVVSTEGAGPTLRYLVTWTPPLADTRLYPAGQIAYYSIEYRSPTGIQKSGDGQLNVEWSPNRD
jgi:hypothetical protein